MNGLTNLAQYGLAGVSIALIILLSFVIGKVIKLVENHIRHNTEAMTQLTDVIKELKEFLMFRDKK